ncbi:MAG: hypothetical protein NC900_04665 [Candidatus Omnitrophica bacterium]|nr:hypothetical protein [Candidatus Omnitrophota bacterium]
MEKKIRLLFFVLVIITIASILFGISAINSREALRKEYEEAKEIFKRENSALTKKANQALEEKKNLEKRLEEIKMELDKISAERNELQAKYNAITKEKEELLSRIKTLSSVATISAPPSPTKPTETPDSYWAGILQERARLQITVERLKDQLDKFVVEMEEIKKDKSNLELEIKNLQRDREDLSRRLEYARKIADSLSLDLVREKKDKQRLEEELKVLKSEHLAAVRKLNTLNEEKFNLEKRIREIETEKSKLEHKVKEEASLLEEKPSFETKETEKTPSSKESVELPPIVVRPPEITSETSPVGTLNEGKVLAVNKEHNFIVIDLGEEQGINAGNIFEVYRGNQKIATVEVIQTRRNVSACDIRQQLTPIKVGDRVIR